MLVDDSWSEIGLRLGLATIIGLILGLDRELRGHDAGLRTNALVALSSAMVTLSSLMLFDTLKHLDSQPDPLRVIQGVAQAIGFIAAGLIFVSRGDVKNITTAANLWMSAAAGIVAGLGQFKLLAIGEIVLLARAHVVRLNGEERRRLLALVRKGRGRGRRLDTAERDELARLIAKAEPRLFAGSVAKKLSPVPLPKRVTHGPRKTRTRA